jgi:hypothetical protein
VTLLELIPRSQKLHGKTCAELKKGCYRPLAQAAQLQFALEPISSFDSGAVSPNLFAAANRFDTWK